MSLVSYGGRRLTDLGAPRAGSSDAVRMVDLEAASVGGGGGPVPTGYPQTDYLINLRTPVITSGNEYMIPFKGDDVRTDSENFPLPSPALVTFPEYPAEDPDQTGSEMYFDGITNPVHSFTINSTGTYSFNFYLAAIVNVLTDTFITHVTSATHVAHLASQFLGTGMYYGVSNIYVPLEGRQALDRQVGFATPPVRLVAGTEIGIDFFPVATRITGTSLAPTYTAWMYEASLAITKWSDG